VSNLHIIKAKWLSTNVDQDVRNIGLDIIRAACAIFVVLAHTNNILGKYLPVYKVLFPIGSLAQEVFFSLSGFLIGSQLLKFANKDFQIKQLFGFYLKRWIRTVPFYFLFIGINYFIYIFWYKNSGLNLFSADFNVGGYFSFSQNLFDRHPVFYPEIWPIPIEEWSYLLIPLPLIMVCFISKNSPFKYFIAVLILLICVINAWRINYVLAYNPEQDWELRKIVAYRMDALLYGVLVSVIVKTNEDFFRKYKTRLLIVGLVVSVTTSFAGLILKSQYINVILFTILPLSSALILPYFRFTIFKNNALSRIMTHTSLVSYAIVLSHLYFLQFLFINMFRPTDLWSAIATTVGYLIVLIIFSTFFYNFVERPVLLLRKN